MTSEARDNETDSVPMVYVKQSSGSPSSPSQRERGDDSNDVLTGVVGGALLAATAGLIPGSWILGGIVGGLLSSEKLRERAAAKMRQIASEFSDKGE